MFHTREVGQNNLFDFVVDQRCVHKTSQIIPKILFFVQTLYRSMCGEIIKHKKIMSSSDPYVSRFNIKLNGVVRDCFFFLCLLRRVYVIRNYFFPIISQTGKLVDDKCLMWEGRGERMFQ